MAAAALLAACSGSEDGARDGDGSGGAPGSTVSSTGGGGADSTTSTGSSSTGGAAPVEPACSVDVPRTVPLEAWVEPSAGQTPFVDALSTAQTSIRVMVYEMGYGQILDTLKAKAAAGVSVRVILDVSKQSINQKYFDALTAAGAEVEWSDPNFTYMHAKAIVIDDAIAVISTGNYLATQMAKERNYVVRDEDPADVVSLAALFDADWDRLAPDLSCTRLLISPVNARDRLLALIDGATTTLDIESMQLADSEVRDAVVARKDAGVTVRIILADPSWIDSNVDAAQFLASHGIEAKYLSTPMVHVKEITVDGARAYIGSENLSWTSLEKNREVGVIAFEDDVLALTAATFESDWAAALDF
jgi:phosphatidylserine/phosphatidylglycerophosphate/cardiolipin synthase-like enzyme